MTGLSQLLTNRNGIWNSCMDSDAGKLFLACEDGAVRVLHRDELANCQWKLHRTLHLVDAYKFTKQIRCLSVCYQGIAYDLLIN